MSMETNERSVLCDWIIGTLILLLLGCGDVIRDAITKGHWESLTPTQRILMLYSRYLISTTNVVYPRSFRLCVSWDRHMETTAAYASVRYSHVTNDSVTQH